MIIEDAIENAIITLLSNATTLTNILRGMEDPTPELVLPALVVQARMDERISAQRGIYWVTVTIEYKTIPEENLVDGTTGVQAAMNQVDLAIMQQPNPYIQQLVATEVQSILPEGSQPSIFWHSVNRTMQDVHTDRRTNTRELKVCFAPS